MIHPKVSDLPGLLLQVVLAVHAVVDHQPYVVRHVECIENSHVNHYNKSLTHPSKKIQPL